MDGSARSTCSSAAIRCQSRLYYRVYGRGKEGQRSCAPPGRSLRGKSVVAFGGTPNMPMTISFSVNDYLPAGAERDICVPIDLPTGKMDQGIAACRLEMTVGGETKEIWLRRSTSLDQPRPEVLPFRDGVYALAFDADRKPLGFELKLDDFEVGFEPGTQQPTTFESQVRLTDKSANIRDEAHTIWMNHPLDHNGYTFYQMRYQPDIDPQTERPTGRFLSVFQVATNPGPADHLRRLPAGRPGDRRPVLHEGGRRTLFTAAARMERERRCRQGPRRRGKGPRDGAG